jgi:hypothetical protein
VCKILDQEEVKPHKVRYYLEQRDPDFAEKMAEVLCVYRQVRIHGTRRRVPICTVAGRRTSLCSRIRHDDRLTAFAPGIGGGMLTYLHF